MQSTSQANAWKFGLGGARRVKADWLAQHDLDDSWSHSDIGEAAGESLVANIGTRGSATIGPSTLISGSVVAAPRRLQMFSYDADFDVDAVVELDHDFEQNESGLLEAQVFSILSSTIASFTDKVAGLYDPTNRQVMLPSSKESQHVGWPKTFAEPNLTALCTLVSPTRSLTTTAAAQYSFCQPMPHVAGYWTKRTIVRQLEHNGIISWLGTPDLTVRIAHRLARIPELPHAEDSILPSSELIDAALRVAGYLPTSSVLPQIEVDDSAGSIAFVWRDDASESAFSLEIPNPRVVIGVAVGKAFAKYKPWRHSIFEERKIVEEFQSSGPVRRLLSGE
ncbi:hypothetical protein S58_16270 [Bradyrhizobium oligotrophicum S58]|uniref:Uncharacterized protein n=1 Tax=Bradyrhizobium oligotrophicum S58 TaxID=1245469 RepID=M4ZN54_9BRAD|nr:hypothetical protein [Bradyrhizobium oligotrophicum]BAM87635.1 hypothetical protein S58_16270 [Bradyrhizobium oligotrophicum S58]